ncbi:hypothetical protein Thermo_01008 [Thermoplasmatales archaeon]|nr:hypothetical protein Thermo_01008 [Thermoplasmatales archaeon]
MRKHEARPETLRQDVSRNVCGLTMDRDLNAARNIGVLGKSEYFRLQSTSQSSRFNDLPVGRGETSDKLRSLSEE